MSQYGYWVQILKICEMKKIWIVWREVGAEYAYKYDGDTFCRFDKCDNCAVYLNDTYHYWLK